MKCLLCFDLKLSFRWRSRALSFSSFHLVVFVHREWPNINTPAYLYVIIFGCSSDLFRQAGVFLVSELGLESEDSYPRILSALGLQGRWKDQGPALGVRVTAALCTSPYTLGLTAGYSLVLGGNWKCKYELISFWAHFSDWWVVFDVWTSPRCQWRKALERGSGPRRVTWWASFFDLVWFLNSSGCWLFLFFWKKKKVETKELSFKTSDTMYMACNSHRNHNV